MWHTWNPGKTGDWLQQLDDLCHIHSSFELTKKVTCSIYIHIFWITHKILFSPLGSVFCFYNLVLKYRQNSFFIGVRVSVGGGGGGGWGEVSKVSNCNLITSHFMLLVVMPTPSLLRKHSKASVHKWSRWCMDELQSRLTYILPHAHSYCDYLWSLLFDTSS